MLFRIATYRFDPYKNFKFQVYFGEATNRSPV
jgi:hypothetical protein